MPGRWLYIGMVIWEKDIWPACSGLVPLENLPPSSWFLFFFFIAGVSGDSALDSVSYHCGLLAKYATSPDLSFLKGVGIDSHSSTTLWLHIKEFGVRLRFGCGCAVWCQADYTRVTWESKSSIFPHPPMVWGLRICIFNKSLAIASGAFSQVAQLDHILVEFWFWPKGCKRHQHQILPGETWHSAFGLPVAWLSEPFQPVSFSLTSELVFPTSLHHVLLCMASCSMWFGSGCCRLVPAAFPTVLS